MKREKAKGEEKGREKKGKEKGKRKGKGKFTVIHRKVPKNIKLQ